MGVENGKDPKGGSPEPDSTKSNVVRKTYWSEVRLEGYLGLVRGQSRPLEWPAERW